MAAKKLSGTAGDAVAVPRVDVTLAVAHTHAGRRYQPGMIITVTRDEARFLLNHKVIKTIPVV